MAEITVKNPGGPVWVPDAVDPETGGPGALVDEGATVTLPAELAASLIEQGWKKAPKAKAPEAPKAKAPKASSKASAPAGGTDDTTEGA